MFYLLACLLLGSSPFILADETAPSDDAESYTQKTGHQPPRPPPPQTSNAVFLKSQKTVFEGQSPRNCGDGKVAVKGEHCDVLFPKAEDGTDQKLEQDTSD